MRLEFLLRETRAQSEEGEGWGSCSEDHVQAWNKAWLRYIPVSQSRIIARSKIKIIDAQAVDILTI